MDGEAQPTRITTDLKLFTTRYGGRMGLPFFVPNGQAQPEYDQGDSVIVWYDDLVNLVAVLRSIMGPNNCCCPFGIGNPMVNDHLATCKAAQDVLK